MVLTLILISLERQTSCLQNTLIFSTPMSRDTKVGAHLYNPRLGHQCTVVAKGLSKQGFPNSVKGW